MKEYSILQYISNIR